ncbi:MAG: 50S ribosomal protein L6 [Minisyncoccales bacterium]
MSKIGKKPIFISPEIKVEIFGQKILVQGTKGLLEREIPSCLKIEKKESSLIITPQKDDKKTKSLWGLFRTLISNMIEGVSKGFEKKLEVVGVGYSASLEENNLVLKVGYAHLVKIPIPVDLKVSVEKNIITIQGIDKEKVGNFAAKIRNVRKPDAYKGKGIRYLGEKIKLKPVKKAVASST